jgi:hypothetical protein
MKRRIFKVDGHDFKVGTKKDAQYFVNQILRKEYKIKVEFGTIEDGCIELCEMKMITSK